MKKRTKIIASIGPASSSGAKLEKMLNAGTDVFRINLSHTKIEDAKKIIDLVRSKEKKTWQTCCNNVRSSRAKNTN